MLTTEAEMIIDRIDRLENTNQNHNDKLDLILEKLTDKIEKVDKKVNKYKDKGIGIVITLSFVWTILLALLGTGILKF